MHSPDGLLDITVPRKEDIGVFFKPMTPFLLERWPARQETETTYFDLHVHTTSVYVSENGLPCLI